jgi:hypothetical protein
MPWRFMAVSIVHRVPVKLRAVFHRMFATRRHRPMVALAIVKVMVDVTVEVLGAMEPRSGADEYPA